MGKRQQQSSEDESAPLFFLLAILGCVVTPWFLSVLWTLLFPGQRELKEKLPDTTEDGLRVRHVQTRAMTEKREALRCELQSRRRLFTRGFILRSSILALLMCWLFYIVVQVRTVLQTSAMYQNFDPYQILEVSRSASSAEVKKAMRRLSLKYHPDKNREPGAAERFMLITKAHDALTDPVAKRNYAKYGNPDGPSRVELGVALPAISKESQGLVLVLFVLVFILGVPLTFLWCMGGGGQTCANGVLRDTMQAVVLAMKDSHLDLRAAMELLVNSAESSESMLPPQRPGDEEPLAALRADLPAPRAPAGKSKAGKNPEAAASKPTPPGRAAALLLAHLQRRHSSLSEGLASDLDGLLKSWRLIALSMAEVAVHQDSLPSLEAAIEVHRCLVQGLDPNSSLGAAVRPLLQVPHFDADIVKAWRKGPRKAAGLPALLELAPEERRASFDGLGLDAQALLDIEEFAATAPRITLGPVQVSVEGEDNICQGDIATLSVALRRENLREGEAVGAVHTPLFPAATVIEAWWLIVQFPDKKARLRCERLTDTSREFTAEIKFKVATVGKSRCTVRLLSESFTGLDVEQQVSFVAKKGDGGGGGGAGSSSEGEDDGDHE